MSAVMKTRSIRLAAEDLSRAEQLGVDVNVVSRNAIRTAIHEEAAKIPMQFISFKKKCNCGHECTQANSIKISVTELGVWFTCTSCESTGMTGSYKINYKK